MDEFIFDVTILVATYNPVEVKLYKTLKSVLLQKDIDCQIIIVDDGSKEFNSDNIEEFFKKNNFSNYHLVKNEKNQGTVKNIKSGMELCKGKYVKLISPGDYLYGDTVLKKWLKFVEQENAEWSFGDAIYYSFDKNDNFIVRKEYANPQDIKCYISQKQKKCVRNYLISDDLVLGASILCRRDVLNEYLDIIENRVVYAEDNVYRIMMYDGKVAAYYPQIVVLYEYGSGVSTSKNKEWSKKLHLDFNNTNDIIYNKKTDLYGIKKDFYRVYNSYENKIKKHLSCIFVKGYLYNKIKFKINKRYTRTDIDYNYIKMLEESDKE